MGLDMYAVRRTYVRNWPYTPKKELYTVHVLRGGKPAKGINPERISYIEEESMYWRKANHIHAWFVDNVQDGQDNCQDYRVSTEKLRELLAVCERVIEGSKLVDGPIPKATLCEKDLPHGHGPAEPGKVIKDATVAKELLPTCKGFFFGSSDYDEYYLGDVVETRDWLIRTLADIDAGVPGDIYYSSSW